MSTTVSTNRPSSPPPAPWLHDQGVDAMTNAERYAARQEAGDCTYGSVRPCARRPADGDQLCAHHLAKYRKRRRAANDRIRAEHRAAGECADGCGTKTDKYRCEACAIRAGKIPSLGEHNGEHKQPSTDAQWRAGTHASDAMTARYRGRAKRGKPPDALIDDQDLADAQEALAKARKALAVANSPAVAALPRIQRQAVTREALAYVGHSARFGTAVLARHKLAAPDEDAEAPDAWEFSGGPGLDIANDAKAGELVYAPPPAAQAGKPAAKAPDLAGLRRSLAARGLELEGCGAFYWRITAARKAVA